ncbi:hypothetical protein SPB_1040 [Streptococcus parauberis NCFD 2020]|uniref:Uncharacterized protein n=1 Tax=Streptococcus parauberis NCFD 2020 TaxID=873447 RepID=F1Z2H3_9STRE|nr:hypothetical protein SPB_1040 [Streptococcus parauberis NCFD 2020]
MLLLEYYKSSYFVLLFSRTVSTLVLNFPLIAVSICPEIAVIAALAVVAVSSISMS